MLANDHCGARRLWSRLERLVPLLFREANPMPIKYCLWRQGLPRSPECRLPLTRVSSQLAAELDQALKPARRLRGRRGDPMTALPNLGLSRHFSRWEFTARYNLAASDAQGSKGGTNRTMSTSISPARLGCGRMPVSE